MIVIGDTVAKWVCEATGVRFCAEDCRAVGWMREGKLVAGIVYAGHTGASILMHQRIEDGSKLSREWLFAIFDYPFNQLKVKRVTALIPSNRLQAQEICKRLGGKYETVLKDYFDEGDGLVFVMRREDCKWLNYTKPVEVKYYGKKFTENS